MWAFYKTKAAFQFKLIPATMEVVKSTPVVKKYGAVYIEAATGVDKVYDWSAKLNFAVSDGDLSLVYTAFRGLDKTGKINLELPHDPGAGTETAKQTIKRLSVQNATNPGTYYLTLSQTVNKVMTKVSIGITEGELHKLRLYIEQNQNKILGVQ